MASSSIDKTVERGAFGPMGASWTKVLFFHLANEHPVHLHRHTFEITKVGDKTTSGVMKDTISMPRYSTAEIDFVADESRGGLLIPEKRL